MTPADALTLLADWLEARCLYNALSARCWEPDVESELSEAALRVLRSYGKLENLSSKNVRRWAAEAAAQGMSAEAERVGGQP